MLAGRFNGDLAAGIYRAVPNPEVVRPTIQFMRETLRETPTGGVRMAYAFFLLHAIRQAHEDGNTPQAEAWLRDLNRTGEGLFRPMSLNAVVSGQMPEMLR